MMYNTLANAVVGGWRKSIACLTNCTDKHPYFYDFKGLCALKNPNPAWYDRFYKMRQLRFVKGDCVQMPISGYYGFRV